MRRDSFILVSLSTTGCESRKRQEAAKEMGIEIDRLSALSSKFNVRILI